MSLEALLDQAAGKPVTFLTGAGISAPSGIPTFRGKGGFWTVGSTVYRAQELATRAHFRSDPWDVWAWYLYRKATCDQAKPNTAHFALANLEARLGERFHLVTQNVDGLHTRAGNRQDRIFEVHGSGRLMRCARHCTMDRFPIPESIVLPEAGQPIDEVSQALLVCPKCGNMARPHILWFDEYYDETLYRSQSALHAVADSGLFVTIGTSGATSLPSYAIQIANERGAVVVDINPESNPFRRNAERTLRGTFLDGDATQAVPALCDRIGHKWGV